MTTEELRYAGHGGDEVAALLCTPPAVEEPAPAVVVVHDVFGIDAHARSVAERLAGEGHVALVPDLWTREGGPGSSAAAGPAPSRDAAAIRAAAEGLPDRRALGDLDAAAARLAGRNDVDPERIAVLGFGMGGTLAFLACCTSTRFSAGVDFQGRPLYPELNANRPTQPLELALNLDVPLLAFFGGRDEDVPEDAVERMRQSLAAGAKNHEIITYPDARHGFFDASRPAFDDDVAADAWRRTIRFFREVL